MPLASARREDRPEPRISSRIGIGTLRWSNRPVEPRLGSVFIPDCRLQPRGPSRSRLAFGQRTHGHNAVIARLRRSAPALPPIRPQLKGVSVSKPKKSSATGNHDTARASGFPHFPERRSISGIVSLLANAALEDRPTLARCATPPQWLPSCKRAKDDFAVSQRLAFLSSGHLSPCDHLFPAWTIHVRKARIPHSATHGEHCPRRFLRGSLVSRNCASCHIGNRHRNPTWQTTR
jgi:hypothetical protein